MTNRTVALSSWKACYGEISYAIIKIPRDQQNQIPKA